VKADIKFVGVGPNKFNPEQTCISIGFDLGEEKLTYMRYVVAGGTEGQLKFASIQLANLLKNAGPYEVTTKENERGYLDVYANDPNFRPNGATEVDDLGF
jgi:hypothetical protein